VMGILRIEEPVSFGGLAGNICRQVDEVCGSGILDIEEGLLPLPARF
jgi:hypothetical protein